MPIYFTNEKPAEMQVDAIVSPGEQVAGVTPGEVFITKTENKPATFIIHTPYPARQEGLEAETAQFRQTCSSSLELAKASGCESLAIPLNSSSVGAARQAIESFLEENEMKVFLALQTERQAFLINGELSAKIKAYIDDTLIPESSFARKIQKADLRDETLELAEMSMFRTPAPKRSLEDLVNNLDETFSEMLLRLIDEKGFSDVETYKKANIDRKLFSKIRSNRDYHPSKPTALALAIALELNLDETTDLLKKAGLALSHSSKFDVIIEYFIVNRNHDIFEINEALFSFDQVLLGG